MSQGPLWPILPGMQWVFNDFHIDSFYNLRTYLSSHLKMMAKKRGLSSNHALFSQLKYGISNEHSDFPEKNLRQLSISESTLWLFFLFAAVERSTIKGNIHCLALWWIFLVSVYKKLWKESPSLMGKSTFFLW